MAGESSFGVQPLRVGNPLLYPRKIFLNVLKLAFSQDRLLEYIGAPKNFHKIFCREDGSIDNEKSGLLLSDEYDTEQKSKPQIVIGRGQLSWSDLVLGDRDGSSAQFEYPADFKDHVAVPVTFTVYAREQLEAEDLAWAVSLFIKIHEKEIREGSSIGKIESTSIGPATPIKGSADFDTFEVQLQTLVTMSFSWRKMTTLTIDEIKSGICRASGEIYPMYINDLCVVAKPANAPDPWV